jgi:cellulose synthase operon protein C
MTADEHTRWSIARFLTLRRALAVGVLLLVAGTLLMAQTRPGPAPVARSSTPSTPADAALRALNLGRFDEVERLLGGATDPRSIAIRARADIARGRYAEAEKLLSGPAKAQPRSDAALELGLLQLMLGRRAEGTSTLERVLDLSEPGTAADYLRLARAASGLGHAISDAQMYRDANSYFQNANRLAPGDPVINTAWGELFLEKYEREEAVKSFDVALKADEENVAAIVGKAHLTIEENPPNAKAEIERALKTNPSYTPAHLFAAEIALDERRRDDAKASIEAALKVNPNSLEARSLQAAVAFLEGREADFERQAQEVLKINPVYGEVYRTVGDHLARNYRFDEAVAMTRRGLKIDPGNAQAQADLGLHLMRTGDEAAARVSLEAAYKSDPFHSSLMTKNLLTLLDDLDTFETITDGKIVMKLHRDEVGVMREQALPLAKEALATLEKRYNFTAQGPILVEMFPKHDDFAVRTLGLPGMIGALGACFGRVVTLDSPRARPPGQFNWGETLWHEMAHVITLQMSNNRLPRWLSEGTSVFEERRARPEWGREMDVAFAQALDKGKTLKLADLNEGFSDPRTISLAYYQSSLVVEHLVETYGEPKFHQFVRAYGRGIETEEALKETFGAAIDEIQVAFDARLEKQYGALRRALTLPETKETTGLDELKALATSNPESFGIQMQLGIKLSESGDKAAAIQAFERASALVPWATGENNPNALIAAVALEQKDTPRAIRALQDLLKVDHSDVESARKLVSLVEPLGDVAGTEQAYRRVVDVDPFDSRAQTGLGRLALRRKDTESAVRAFRSALAANPADRASAHVDLAEALVGAGDLPEAKKQTLAALEIAPSFERAQDLLLKIVNAGGGGV